MSWLELELSSNIISILNFFLFDILFITLVYSLSSDIIGRLNDKELRKGGRRILHICTPTFIGSGLCSISESPQRLMRSLRVITIISILVSNIAMEGFERGKVITALATVRTQGSLAHMTATDVREAAISASSCMRDERPPDFIYFGELRVIDGNTQCVSDAKLLPHSSFLLGLASELSDISTTPGVCERENGDSTRAEFICERSMLSCERDISGRALNLTCRGLLTYRNDTYIVEAGAVWPGKPPSVIQARLVNRVDWSDPEWLVAMRIASYGQDMQDILLAASIAHRHGNIRSVLVYKKVAVTRVNAVWVGAVSMCTAIVMSLTAWSARLRMQGYPSVLHDEISLREMLVSECQFRADFLSDKAIRAFYNDTVH